MFCQGCGAKNNDDARFCFSCGRALADSPFTSASGHDAHIPQSYALKRKKGARKPLIAICASVGALAAIAFALIWPTIVPPSEVPGAQSENISRVEDDTDNTITSMDESAGEQLETDVSEDIDEDTSTVIIESSDTSEFIQPVPIYYEGDVHSNRVEDYIVEPTSAADVYDTSGYPQLANDIAYNLMDIVPLLDIKGKPIFDIVNFKTIVDGWYVARIQYHGKKDTGSWVLLQRYTQNGNRVRTIAGPSSNFDIYDLYEYNVPLEVYYSYKKV
jgi:hypothetical protein